MSTGCFKNVILKLNTYKSYVICIRMDLALNNLQELICHKTYLI